MRQTISGMVAAVAVMRRCARDGVRLLQLRARRLVYAAPAAVYTSSGCNPCGGVRLRLRRLWLRARSPIPSSSITTSTRARPIPVRAPGLRPGSIRKARSPATATAHGYGYGYGIPLPACGYGQPATAMAPVTATAPVRAALSWRHALRRRLSRAARVSAATDPEFDLKLSAPVRITRAGVACVYAAHQAEPAGADIERQHRGVRDVEALDLAGHVEPRHRRCRSRASIAASPCLRRPAPAPAAAASATAPRSSLPSLSSPTVMKPRSFSSVSARARFCTVTSGTSSSAPEADFASTPVASGLCRAVVTIALTANAAAERRIAPTLCGSVIWSSTSTMPSCGSVVDVGRGQGIGLRQQALMHGVRAEPLVDQVRPHDFRGHAGVDVVVGQPPRGVFGQQQLANLALRIGQRRRHRVPAIENDRPVGAALAVAPGRPAAGFRPFSKGLPPPRRNAWFSIAIAHGPACVTGSG